MLKLYTETGGSGTFFVKLFSDNANQPGTALATLASGPNPLSVGFQATDVAFNGLNQPLLANTNYWIVFGDNPGPARPTLECGQPRWQRSRLSGFQMFHGKWGNILGEL